MINLLKYTVKIIIHTVKNNFTDNYLFIESPSNNSNNSEYLTQYWSHGGLSSHIESEILYNIN